MSNWIATLLTQDRRAQARTIALAALLTGSAFWVIESAANAFLWRQHGIVEELLHPPADEISIRLLVTALLVVLYLGRQARSRLFLLSSALAAAPDGVQIATLDGKIGYSNRTVEAIYGFTPEELLGIDVNEMNVDPTFASREILPALRRTGRWAGELEVKHKNGRAFPIWLTTSTILDRGGSPIAAVGIIRDISDRKRAEQELRSYAHRLEEATELKELFADILRHDLLGPASTMKTAIDVLLKQPQPESSQRLLAAARRSCAKLTDVIEGAARFAKLSAPQQIELGTIDLGAVLKGVLTDFELPLAEANARIAFEPRGEYPARANPVVAEVFSNLLSNAIKYGPAGGTIRIDVHDAGGRWRVSVADSGSGIPDRDKEKVFTRFERLQKEGVKGTGLGLAIAKRIVEIHDGRIWVEDAPSGGTVFWVELPKA